MIPNITTFSLQKAQGKEQISQMHDCLMINKNRIDGFVVISVIFLHLPCVHCVILLFTKVFNPVNNEIIYIQQS